MKNPMNPGNADFIKFHIHFTLNLDITLNKK